MNIFKFFYRDNDCKEANDKLAEMSGYIDKEDTSVLEAMNRSFNRDEVDRNCLLVTGKTMEEFTREPRTDKRDTSSRQKEIRELWFGTEKKEFNHLL